MMPTCGSAGHFAWTARVACWICSNCSAMVIARGGAFVTNVRRNVSQRTLLLDNLASMYTDDYAPTTSNDYSTHRNVWRPTSLLSISKRKLNTSRREQRKSDSRA